MKLAKITPTLPATSVRPEFERLVDRVFGNQWPFASLLETPAAPVMWNPSLDFSDTDKEYIVRMEVPGIPKENLDIQVEGQLLTLTGHREVRKESEHEEFFWREREEGRFVRTLRLPAPVIPQKIEAICQDGVMTVHLPKAEPVVKNKITIK
jgi:HSP20 family protein